MVARWIRRPFDKERAMPHLRRLTVSLAALLLAAVALPGAINAGAPPESGIPEE